MADENLPASTVRLSASVGYEVNRQNKIGLADTGVLAMARETDAVLLSQDKDMRDFSFRDLVPPPVGVVLFRFDSNDPSILLGQRLLDLLFEGVEIIGYFTVITPENYRQRRLP